MNDVNKLTNAIDSVYNEIDVAFQGLDKAQRAVAEKQVDLMALEESLRIARNMAILDGLSGKNQAQRDAELDNLTVTALADIVDCKIDLVWLRSELETARNRMSLSRNKVRLVCSMVEVSRGS